MGGPITAAGPSSAGNPGTGAVAGVAAGALLSEVYGELHDLALPPADAQLYRQRLSEGDSIVAVDTDAAHAAQVVEELRRHHAADIRGG